MVAFSLIWCAKTMMRAALTNIRPSDALALITGGIGQYCDALQCSSLIAIDHSINYAGQNMRRSMLRTSLSSAFCREIPIPRAISGGYNAQNSTSTGLHPCVIIGSA